MDLRQKRKRLILQGGFHSAGQITLWVYPNMALSRPQYKRLQRHFCGVKGCKCGGVWHDSVETVGLDAFARNEMKKVFELTRYASVRDGWA